jgi:hypothetical protein
VGSQVHLVMYLKKIGNDLFGIFFVKKINGRDWASYYESINALRPLFKTEEYNKVVTGFYLNSHKGNYSVRISYFVDKTNIVKAYDLFKNFFDKNEIIESQAHEHPKKIILARNYGGEHLEERFRNFLILETKIGLDLLDMDQLNTRILFAIFVFQIRNMGSPIRNYFETTLKKYSLTYNSLSNNEKRLFFDYFEIWNHFMVNSILGSLPILC